MKGELIIGHLMAVAGEKLTIYTETHTPEGETLTLSSTGLPIDEDWIRHWLGRRGTRFTIIDDMVKEVSE